MDVDRQESTRAKPSIWLSWGRLFLPLVVAIAVAVIVVPRLVDGPLETSAGAFSIQARCIAQGTSNEAEVIAEAGPQQTLRCPIAATVRFRYSAPSAARVELALMQEGQEKILLPLDSQRPALGPAKDAPLPLSSSAKELGEGTHQVKARFIDPETGEALDVTGPTLELYTAR